jgi:hypothetical protein
MKKIALLIYGNNLHYLDHLAPLSYFLNIPLITNIEEIAKIAKKYYPNIKIHYVDDLNIHFYIVENFDNIITCITKDIFDANFRFHQDILNKDIKIIWCPHGNSDKGKTCFFFESLKNGKAVFVYGKKMIDFLKEKKVFHTIESYAEIGNYRLNYYEQFKYFFKKIVEKEIKFKLPVNKINILYAPTWQDAENSSSFDEDIENLLKKVPFKYNLILKMHPNLLEKYFSQIEILKNKYKNVLLLNDFPLIYPLLDFIDVYLGDFSSIGYDFLYFQKPMFFLEAKNKQLTSDLFKCGKILKKNKLFETLEKNINNRAFENVQKKLYKYTFKEKINFQSVKKIVFK